jgi:hypothetical protein
MALPEYFPEGVTASALPKADGMCEKCTELDTRIDRYKRLAAAITDGRTIDGIKALIGKMEAEKVALQPSKAGSCAAYLSGTFTAGIGFVGSVVNWPGRGSEIASTKKTIAMPRIRAILDHCSACAQFD